AMAGRCVHRRALVAVDRADRVRRRDGARGGALPDGHADPRGRAGTGRRALDPRGRPRGPRRTGQDVPADRARGRPIAPPNARFPSEFPENVAEEHMSRVLAAAAAAIVLSAPAWAHHGFGRFDPTRDIELEGTLTGVDFVNPHAYLYFDAAGDDGAVRKMRCEMRAAPVLRRSGWTPEMFVPGSHVTIAGNPHRDDPASCYIETLTIGDRPTLERYQQLTTATQQAPSDRPLRLPSGEPNLAGDWAEAEYLIARPPGGARGGLVPKSLVAAVEAGELSMEDVPNAGWGAAPVTLTAAGQAAADALRNLPPQENPRARCEITSILFDWVFDGPINRITQTPDTITLEYGRGLTRTIPMNVPSH